MALQLIDPRDRYVMRHTALPEEVVGHIRDVLKAYLRKPGYTKFYVGITQDVDRRLQRHQRTKPEYKLMIPVDECRPPRAFGWPDARRAPRRRRGIPWLPRRPARVPRGAAGLRPPDAEPASDGPPVAGHSGQIVKRGRRVRAKRPRIVRTAESRVSSSARDSSSTSSSG